MQKCSTKAVKMTDIKAWDSRAEGAVASWRHSAYYICHYSRSRGAGVSPAARPCQGQGLVRYTARPGSVMPPRISGEGTRDGGM